MGLIARNLTATIKKADGSPWAGGKIRYSVSDTQADGSIVVPKYTVEAIANAQGIAEAALYTLEGSYLNYDVVLPGGDSQTVSLPDEVGDADLSDLWQVAASADIIAVRPATETVLGGVMVDGTTITIDEDGVITAVGGGGGGGGETTTTLGALINGATAKATPVDADMLPLMDSAAANVVKKLSWANVKATLKTYFDTLYQPLNAILTAFVALSPSDDDILQRKAGSWVNRTIAQLKTDLGLSGTNTGDQDLSGYVPNTRTINGLDLSANRTLTQDEIGDGTTNKQYSQTEKTKLAGVATGATANSADAFLLARGNHSGTQLASTISDFNAAALAAAPAETATTAGALVNAAGAATPNNADFVATAESGGLLKKITWTNVKAFLKTYFDTLYAPIGGSGIGGSTGATDNAILRADGTGGATAQSSGATIDDSGNLKVNEIIQGANGNSTTLRSPASGGDVKIQNAFIEQGLVFGDSRRVHLGALSFVEGRPAQIAANQNDYAMGNANATIVYLSADAARNITGISSTLGTASVNTIGQHHILINNGSNAITLKHQDAASTATNRLLNSTGADIVLSANQGADIYYDATAQRWRVFKKT